VKPAVLDAGARARMSLGSSEEAIYRTVETWLAERGASGVLADVGCGTGNLSRLLGPRFERVIGVDVVQYAEPPSGIEFRRADLDRDPLPLQDGEADVAVAVETIEHLENPRALVRELGRVVRPGGWVLVTTPNQLSVLSLITLVVKQRFSAFQDGAYPAHRTALLEIDLRRIAAEAGLEEVEVRYTCSGRVPLTPLHYPRALSRGWPRGLSDNVLLAARVPRAPRRGA
jgi:2-polyprenyl-3-methyl-5-hydroxy-6-metoxy-1,4-benzoquinol methylase